MIRLLKRTRVREHSRMLGLAAAGFLAVTNVASANEVLCDTGDQSVPTGTVSCGDYGWFGAAHEGGDIGVTVINMVQNNDSLNGVPYYCDAYGATAEPNTGLSFLRGTSAGLSDGPLEATAPDGSKFFAHLAVVRMVCFTFDPAPPGTPPPAPAPDPGPTPPPS
jgi:hypothetical protein